MESRKYCVYKPDPVRGFLSLGVTVADTAAKQLKVLMESLSIKADAGLWLTPFRGVPATKGLTPVDLIYLDEDNRVIQAIESFPVTTRLNLHENSRQAPWCLRDILSFRRRPNLATCSSSA